MVILRCNVATLLLVLLFVLCALPLQLACPSVATTYGDGEPLMVLESKRTFLVVLSSRASQPDKKRKKYLMEVGPRT